LLGGFDDPALRFFYIAHAYGTHEIEFFQYGFGRALADVAQQLSFERFGGSF
jgi:hypothetical protein